MRKTETEVRTNSDIEREAAHTVTSLIRQSSEAGQLIRESDIVDHLITQHLSTSRAAEAQKEAKSILRKAVERSEDLHELVDREGSTGYYSSLCMTEPYARILHQRENDRPELIAEIVRQHSALYPRPVPVDLFTQSPFGFAPEQVLADLERMAADERYKDIAKTTTSGARVFLFSTLHLEPEYASMLAEWVDVGQLDNP